MGTLVCFHAHPDDEAIATGGSMASVVWQKFMTDAHRGKRMVGIPGTPSASAGVGR